jgi:hypothetical protein
VSTEESAYKGRQDAIIPGYLSSTTSSVFVILAHKVSIEVATVFVWPGNYDEPQVFGVLPQISATP